MKILHDLRHFTFCRTDASKFWRNVRYLGLLQLLLNKQNLVLFLMYLCTSSNQSLLMSRMNWKNLRMFHICQRCFLHYVTYVTLRIDTYNKRFVTIRCSYLCYIMWGWKTGITLKCKCKRPLTMVYDYRRCADWPGRVTIGVPAHSTSMPVVCPLQMGVSRHTSASWPRLTCSSYNQSINQSPHGISSVITELI